MFECFTCMYINIACVPGSGKGQKRAKSLELELTSACKPPCSLTTEPSLQLHFSILSKR